MKYCRYVDERVSSLEGKTYVVTGSTNGIGLEASRFFLYKGANLIMAVRNLSKAEEVKEEFLKQFPNANIEILKYDQADFASIEEFVNKIKNRKIDCLVLNAGIYHPKKNQSTVDGYPLTVGTNYLGAFYLTKLLDESFKNQSIKRVVVTSSVVHVIGHTKHLEKYLLNERNHRNRMYNVSKQFNYQFAGNLKAQYPNLEVVLTHPGIAKTNIIKSGESSFKAWFQTLGARFLKIFGNSAEKSAICTFFASTIDAGNNIKYVYPRGLFHFTGYPKIACKKCDKIKNEQLSLISNKIISN